MCADNVKVLSRFKHLSPMAKRSRALGYLSLALLGVGSNPAGDIVLFCMFCFLPVPHSLAKPNENKRNIMTNAIKHDIHPE